MDPLTNEDVADILALLDSLPYDELDLETPRFRLTLRRTPAGWTQSTQVHATPASGAPASAAHGMRGPQPSSIGVGGTHTSTEEDGSRAGEADEAEGELVVEVGSRVGAGTVIGIVETMKLMNSVPAGVAGVVAEFCVANAEFAAQGAELLRIRADR